MKINKLSLVFAIIVILCSGLIGRILDNQLGEDKPGMSIWLGLPFLIIILLRIISDKGLKTAGMMPKLKGNLSCYLVSIFLMPLFVIIISFSAGLFKAADINYSLLQNQGDFTRLLFTLILSGLIKNLFEEFVWRGYFSLAFDTMGLSRFYNHLITGLLWGLWHIPYLGFVLSYIEEDMITLIPRFLLSTIAFSMVAGEIRLRSKSLIPVLLMHTTAGVAIGLAYAQPQILEFHKLQWFFSPGLEGFFMIIIMAGFGALMISRKQR